MGTTGAGKDSTYTENQVLARWRWFYMGTQLGSLIDVIDGLKHRIEKLQSARVESMLQEQKRAPRFSHLSR